MKRLFSLMMATLVASAAYAQSPPRVVRTVPEHGEVSVDPKLKSIRVEFDRAISTNGQSICGGGPKLPTFDGETSWIDAKTLSIPVALKPGQDYVLSINCQSFQNFRDTNGQAVTPYPISFRTLGEGEKAPLPLTVEQNKASLKILRDAVEKRYSYRDLRKVDWAKRFDEFQKPLEECKTAAAFARVTAELLSAAKDIHIGVMVNGSRHSAFLEAMPAMNFNGRVLDRSLKTGKRHNNTVVTGMLDDDIAYLMITTWGGNGKDLEPALKFIDEHTNTKAMVVDVRMNGGGNELLARRIAGCFIKDKVVYAKNRTRDPNAMDGWTVMLPREVGPNPNHKFFAGKVAVLIGPMCMSSNESFIMMMKQSKNVTLIGEATFGSSGNPKPYDLGNGVSCLLPSWQDYFPDGTLHEGKGIAPDRIVKTSTWDQGDVVLRDAISFLKK